MQPPPLRRGQHDQQSQQQQRQPAQPADAPSAPTTPEPWDTLPTPGTPDISALDTTVLRPEIAHRYAPRAATPAPPPLADLQERLIAEHEAAARRCREQAEELSLQIKHRAEHMGALVVRWRALSRVPRRSAPEAAELARLEYAIPEETGEMARMRKRWTEYIVAAREHEDTAQRLLHEHA